MDDWVCEVLRCINVSCCVTSGCCADLIDGAVSQQSWLRPYFEQIRVLYGEYNPIAKNSGLINTANGIHV